VAGKQILETERLLLREFDEDDIAAFFVLGSDPAIIRYTGDPGGGFKGIEQALDCLRTRPMTDYQKYGFGRWACVLKARGSVIGFVGLKHLDDLGEVDLGYRFMPAHWGQGYATEASRATLDYGFARLGMTRIIGLVYPKNAASARVLQKVGLAFVGMIEYRGDNLAKYAIDAPGGPRPVRCG
jgi:[ribosomal protein S5]-alanine N-acetyltransferase